MIKVNHKQKQSFKQSNDINESLIYEPNSIQMPKSVCDYWMARLTPAEFKVLICICRKSLAAAYFNCEISLTDIEEMTGLSRKGITSNLKVLVNYGLIDKNKPSLGNEINSYKILLNTSDNRK